MKTITNWKSWLVLTISLLITVVATVYVRYEMNKTDETEFKFKSKNVAGKIETRLHTHALLLRSGAAFFVASDSVSREDWKSFVEHYQVDLNLPGIMGIGFAVKIPKDKLNEHTQEIRNEGFPEYVVWPEEEREIYTSIIFLEPFSGNNLQAFGYDMMTEPIRKEAMELARDMDVAALSGKVRLIHENGTAVQAGNIMYVPIYQQGVAVNTVEQRRAALKGWIYSAALMDDLISGILRSWESEDNLHKYHLQIYDGLISSSESLLFDSQYPEEQDIAKKYRFNLELPINFNGHHWTLVFNQSKGNIFIDYIGAWGTLVAGFIISLLLFLLTRSLINTKYNALKIAETLTAELKESERLLTESQEIAKLGSYSFDLKTGQWKSSEVLDTIFGIDTSYKRSIEAWRQLIHPDYKELMTEYVNNNVIGQEQVFDKEYKIIRNNDKEERWVHGLGKLEYDDSNNPKSLIGTIIDITEQKRAEERLRLSQERFSIAVAGSNDGIWDWDIITDEVYFSPRWKAMLGYDDEELLNSLSTWKNLLHPEDQKSAFSTLQSYLNNDIPVFEEEFRLRHKDGSYRWMIARGKALLNENGKPYRMAGSNTDITSRKLSEEEINRLSEQNQMILDSIGEGVYGLDLEGKITFVNPAAAKMLGRTVEELIGKEGHANHHYHRSDGSVYPFEECPAYSTLVSGVSLRIDSEVFWHKDGTSFPVEYTSAPKINESGDLVGSVVVFKDITQRKLVEEELRESKKRINTIMETSPVPMILSKMIDREVIIANEAFSKLLKISKSEIIGQKLPMFYHNEENLIFLQEAIKTAGFIDNFELLLKKSDGELFWCSMSLKLLNLNNEQVLIIAFHDISEMKKAEEEIMKHREHLEEMVDERTRELTISEQKLRQSLKGISDYKLALDESSLVAITDSKGIITYANDKFCKVSKFSREELIGNTHRIINSRFHSKEFFKNLWTTISEGKIWRGEIRNKAKDGSYYWVDSTLIPFLDQNGKPYQYLAVRFNITKIKLFEADLIKSKEEAESANRAKSEFLANMSHEIRTPMNAVIGFAELLSKSVQDKKQLSQVESIRSSGKNLLKLINDILDLSKIEAGKIDIIPVPISLVDMLHEIENMFAQRAKEKGIMLSIECEKTFAKTLLLDEVRFRQILFNLIGNAVKFTDIGSNVV